MNIRFPKLRLSWKKRSEKRKFLRGKIGERAEYVKKSILYLINNWPEEYKELGFRELENVERIKNELIELVDTLDNKTIDSLFLLTSGDTPSYIRDQAIRSIEKHSDQRVRSIAKLVEHNIFLEGFEDPFRKCYDRIYQRRRVSSTWKKKKREILGKKEKCEICGSRENLEVHHKRGLSHESLRDLVVLCRKCHKELHTLAERLRWNPYKLKPELLELFEKLERKGILEHIENSTNDEYEYYYILAYYLLKEKAKKK